ncbi:MAG: hypothetical protein JNK57_12250 [Planctomycetaceae bacterium]|nr:hypothetical protein [Planctomycetaceae bacterium]
MGTTRLSGVLPNESHQYRHHRQNPTCHATEIPRRFSLSLAEVREAVHGRPKSETGHNQSRSQVDPNHSSECLTTTERMFLAASPFILDL